MQKFIISEYWKVQCKSDFRYSATLVYNNFIWCSPTAEQKNKIEQTAQEILDVRRKFEGWTLAELYDEKTMPDELREAHSENDRAVLAAYGFRENISEYEIVADLMRRYKNLTSSE